MSTEKTMSICISREGDGEPCPDCGATSTVKVEAVPAHARCLHCGNSWGSGDTVNYGDTKELVDEAKEVIRHEHERFRIILMIVFTMGFLLGFWVRG